MSIRELISVNVIVKVVNDRHMMYFEFHRVQNCRPKACYNFLTVIDWNLAGIFNPIKFFFSWEDCFLAIFTCLMFLNILDIGLLVIGYLLTFVCLSARGSNYVWFWILFLCLFSKSLVALDS